MNKLLDKNVSGFSCDKDNWKKVRFGDIFNIYNWINEQSEKRPKRLVRLMSQSQDSDEGRENNCTNYVLPNNGYILFGDHTCCVKKIVEPCKLLGDGVKLLQPTNNVSFSFLFALLQYRAKQIPQGYARHLSILREIECCIPKKKMQESIALIIESIDNQISTTKLLLSKYESIKKATVNLLGYAKKGWIRIHVGDLGDWFKGHGVSMKDIASSGIPCTMYGDIYVKYKEFFTKVDYFLPKDKADAALNGQYGDLLFTASGETADEIGKCACYLGDADICIGGDIIVLRPFHEFDCRFLAYLLNSPACKSQKATLGQGDAVVHIKQENLQSIELYIPSSLNEQQAISSNIYSIDKKINSVETNLKKLYNINQSLLQYFFCD